jgi:predicted small lipoprotein YifL
MRQSLQRLVVTALLLGAAAGLAACGVRGSLEAPPEAKDESNSASPGTPGAPVPHRSSILDPLLR